MRRGSHRTSIGLAATMLVVLALTVGTSTAAPGPAEIGAWTAPFEEGGKTTPRCRVLGGRIICKPTAVGAAVLRDGRVLYMNGIESGENVQYAAVPEAAPESRGSLSRVLNVLSGKPVFGRPSPQTGVASNPNISSEMDPFGVLGVPGRPGDGLAGTLWGTAGGPPMDPTSPPDDPQQNDGDLFCTDMAQLADGRILVAGGTDWYNEPAGIDRESGGPMGVGIAELEGLRTAQIFDPKSSAYIPVKPMTYGRWYPSLVTLPDGKVFVASGVTKLIKSTQGSQVRRSETFNPATGTWIDNGPSGENSLPLMPRLNLMPNGKVFYAGVGQVFGPMGQAADELLWIVQQFYDPATKSWEMSAVAPFGVVGGASQVPLAMDPPYEKATLLIPGGTLGPTPGSVVATPLSWLVTVDKNGSVTNEQTGTLNNPRWYSSAVTLPTGEVFVTSGASHDEVVAPGTEMPVRTPELYNPATGDWLAMAASARDRTYHNSALLLPDGRVLIGGHAPIWTGYGASHDAVPGFTSNNDKDPSFEVFSPPYLFRGARPKLTGVQSGIRWGQSFNISVDKSASISQVVLSRLPSPQHISDSDARTLRLSFTKSGRRTLTAKAPPNGIAAPPGYYYLFVIKGTGASAVPSVARIVMVGAQNSTAPTTPVYKMSDPYNPPPPTGGSATEPHDSSYVNQPPPMPGSLGVVGMGFVGAGAAMLPARRRRGEENAA